jgi:CubicO group peptidase (beta-lactamase class C family)
MLTLRGERYVVADPLWANGPELVVAPRAAAALDEAADSVEGGVAVSTMLAALLGQRGGVAARAVEAVGIDASALVERVRLTLDGAVSGVDRRGWWRRAVQVAWRADHGHVGTEHLLDALLDVDDALWTEVLRDFGTDVPGLRAQVWRTSADTSAGGAWRSAGSVRLGDAPLAGANGTTNRRLGGDLPAQPVVRDAILRILRREPVIGLAVAVITGGSVVELAGHGWSRLEPRRSFTSDTVSRAGSVTKIVTAVAVLRLAERGLLDLDAPASAYLGSLRLLAPDGSASRATVRQLLTHTGGFGGAHGLRQYDGPVVPYSQRHRQGVRAETGPGTWRYSNDGYAVLAQLVADVSGLPYPDYVTRHVLGPAAMNDSALSAWALPAMAHGHLVDRGHLHTVLDSAVLVPGARDLTSTVTDLARLAIGLSSSYAQRSPLLAPDTITAMTADPIEVAGQRFRQGLGVRVRDIHGHLALGHSGSWPGYRAELWWIPDRRTGVAALANTDITGLTGLAIDILEAL